MAKQNKFGSTINKGELNSLLRLLGEKADPALLGALMREGSGFLRYVGTSAPRADSEGRWQDKVITDIVPDRSSILDLGCGEGDLLLQFAKKKHSRVQGIEIDADQVSACVDKGIPVIQTNLDLGLKGFPDNCFDYVILEETLQTLMRPNIILEEMLRVGSHGIVTFPNFGYWRVRLDFAVRGRMPVTDWLPHKWYETPNIHLFSITDFIEYADENKMPITDIIVIENGKTRPYQEGDNLYAEEAVVVFG